MRNLIRTVALGAGLAVVLAGVSLLMLRHRGLTSRTRAGRAEEAFGRWIRDWSLPSAYRDMRNPVDCDQETLHAARAHWADHCEGCHANDGGGASHAGQTLYPPPPDMRLAATQQEADGALYYAIQNGVPFTGMPAFGQPGDRDLESWKLVCFVRHLPGVSPEEEHEMRTLNPKTDSEREEERAEEEFLNGGGPVLPVGPAHK